MRRTAALVALALAAAGGALLLPAPAAALVAVAAIGCAALIGWRSPPPLAAAASPAPGATLSPGMDLHPLLDLLGEGVVLLDERETVIVANRAAARILQRPREAMEGVSLIRATRDYGLVQVLRESAGTSREVALGDDRVVQASASALAAGPVRAVLTIHDLTPLRHAERARADLVANVSHELRTPITAARALAETLEAGVDEPEQRERFHHQLTLELERLGGMVERLLRLSRLESNADEFALEALDAGELVASAIARMTPVSGRARVTLASAGAPGAGGLVLVDGERALEVLTNLLDNAIRYAPAGSEVTVSLAAAGTMIRCCVHDGGPGILPADRRRIFERFYTADRARGGAGTGLGLAIARHIVSRLGGEIWVADESPGATLCFTLPRAPAGAG